MVKQDINYYIIIPYYMERHVLETDVLRKRMRR